MCLGIPGKIVDIEGKSDMDRKGKILFGGITREVSLAYVPEAQQGDYVIVHAGFAISVLDEEEAAKIFESIRDMGGLEEFPEQDGHA